MEDAMRCPSKRRRPPGWPRGGTDAQQRRRTAANGPTAQTEPPRLRQYFPETMLWLPDAVTDAGRHARAWTCRWPTASPPGASPPWPPARTGAWARWTPRCASSRISSSTWTCPLSLTVGDEVSVPVGVFNYLPEAQTVRLELEQADWFELLGEPVQEMQIGANDISVVYFRVRAKPVRPAALQGDRAWARKMSDAILKQVRVYPDGKQIRFSASDRLQPGSRCARRVTIPARGHPRHAEPDGQDLPGRAQPGGRRAGQHPAHALRLLRADLFHHLPERAGAGLPARPPTRPRPRRR